MSDDGSSDDDGDAVGASTDGGQSGDLGDHDRSADDRNADHRNAADDGDDHPVDATEDDDGAFEEVQFELAEWGGRERKLLDEILNGVRVRRVWQAGTLVVAAGDAEIVDDLIDEIEERAALNLAPGVEPVIYDVRDWPAGLEDRFVEALIEGRIAHLRGYQEITVGVDDEEKVDTLVEEVTAAWEDEQPAEGEEDEPDAQEVLSELFVTSDRLLHDASDKTATVRFDDAAHAVSSMRLPFGFAEADWTAITEAVEGLRELLVDAKADDDDIEESATVLRSLLRPLV